MVDLDTWRDEVRTWLEATLPRRQAEDPDAPSDFSVFRNIPEEQERALLDAARAFQRARFDAGFQAITLDADLGGRGLSGRHATVFNEVAAEFEVPPSTELISVTVALVGPAVALYGTPDLREWFVEKFLSADLLGCQLFSEPGAGSDLAGLSTKAVRTETGWRIDGQKVWTSGARFADYGLLLARTDPSVVKQAGITAFLLPMDADGVEIAPIRQMNGGSSFSEVFCSGVEIGDDLRIGEEGQGWEVANSVLAHERTASGASRRNRGGSFDDLLGLAHRVGRTDEPVVRQRLADAYVRTALHAATVERVARAAAAGEKPGPAASITKLLASENLTLLGEVALEIGGARIVADTGENATFAWTEHLLGSPGYRVAGGSDQIQRNIIGERVLGLPPEPRVDKVPFKDLPRN